jgi:hypothetical protein
MIVAGLGTGHAASVPCCCNLPSATSAVLSLTRPQWIMADLPIGCCWRLEYASNRLWTARNFDLSPTNIGRLVVLGTRSGSLWSSWGQVSIVVLGTGQAASVPCCCNLPSAKSAVRLVLVLSIICHSLPPDFGRRISDLSPTTQLAPIVLVILGTGQMTSMPCRNLPTIVWS